MQASVVGTLIRLFNEFDLSGVLTDPTTVQFRLRLPNEISPSIAWTYGVDVQVVRDAVGQYHVDYIPTLAGTYALSWDAGGNMEVTNLSFFEATTADLSALRVPQYMTSADLDRRVGAKSIDDLFDDDGDGERDPIPLNAVLCEAEDLAATYLLSGWTADNIVNLGKTDETYRAQVAWVAIELATERRGVFIAEDGKGRYWQQYQRSLKYFDLLSKNRLATVSTTSGPNLQENARVNPPINPNSDRFVFAPNARSPNGQGGF